MTPDNRAEDADEAVSPVLLEGNRCVYSPKLSLVCDL